MQREEALLLGAGEALDSGQWLLFCDILRAHSSSDSCKLPANLQRGSQRQPGWHCARMGPAALPQLPHNDLA